MDDEARPHDLFHFELEREDEADASDGSEPATAAGLAAGERLGDSTKVRDWLQQPHCPEPAGAASWAEARQPEEPAPSSYRRLLRETAADLDPASPASRRPRSAGQPHWTPGNWTLPA